MKDAINNLKEEGFKVTGQNEEVTFMSRNADHRVVFPCGMVKRGQPEHRK